MGFGTEQILIFVIAGIACGVVLVRLKLLGGSAKSPATTPGSGHSVSPRSKSSKPTLEEMLVELDKCGVRLAEPFTINDLQKTWSIEDYRQLGYLDLIYQLGETEEQEPFRPLSDCLHTFDTECVEGEHVYEVHLQALAKITHGDLILSDFVEQVPEYGGESRLSFKANGVQVVIDFEQDSDWFSGDVAERFLNLMPATASKRRFFSVDTSGQDVVIGCLFPEQIERLKQLGLDILVYDNQASDKLHHDKQLPILQDGDLRLRPAVIPDDVALAEPWYNDAEVMHFSEGDATARYDEAMVATMYEYLSGIGEFYIIELWRDGGWLPIGDVTLAPDTLPIAIGVAAYRSQGYGKRALSLLIERARQLGWTELRVKHVYAYNERSIRMFISLGFEQHDTAPAVGEPPGYSFRKVL